MTNDDDRLVMVLLLALGAVFLLPAMVLRWAHSATGWLLSHHVLVGAEHAMVVIPGAGAGLDGRRLVVVLLLVPAAYWVGRRVVRVVTVVLLVGVLGRRAVRRADR